MSDTMKWILAGVGAYLIYQWYQESQKVDCGCGVRVPRGATCPACRTEAVGPLPGQLLLPAGQPVQAYPDVIQPTEVIPAIPRVGTPRAMRRAPATADITLAAVRQAVVSQGGDPSSLQSADTWNWYLALLTGAPSPQPESIFPGDPDPHKDVALETWWSGVQPLIGINGALHALAGLGRVRYYPYGGWHA